MTSRAGAARPPVSFCGEAVLPGPTIGATDGALTIGYLRFKTKCNLFARLEILDTEAWRFRKVPESRQMGR